MNDENEQEFEATEEQLDALRELGVDPRDIVGLSMAEAAALIDELRGVQESARKAGRA